MKSVVVLLCAVASQTIIKALTDPRTHHFFVHESGMKVYITGDNTAHKCAAAMRVGVGYLSDPAEWAGIANLVLRSLFLSSEKHPTLNKLSDFVGERGGFSNGFLYEDATSFTFDVQCDHLEAALDIFASLFIAPTFNEEGLRNELSTLEDEFKQHTLLEDHRRRRLLAALANSASPYTKFGNGNMQTLDKPGLLEAVRDFFDKYYKPSRFTLSVYGREPEAAESLVRKLFGDLKADGELPLKYDTELFFRPMDMNKLVRMKSLHQESTMEITLFFHKNEARLDTRPLDLLKHLIENPHRGSFVRKARQWGWITDVVVEAATLINNYSEFWILIELTPTGMRRHEDVRALFFDSVRFLAENIQDYMYDDYKAARRVQFEYASVDTPMNTVLNFAQNSAFYPTEKVLLASYEMGPYSQSEIVEVLRRVIPANAIVILSSQNYKDLPLREPVFGTDYSVEDIKVRPVPNFGDYRRAPRAIFRPSLDVLEAKMLPGKELRAVLHPQPTDITPEGHGREARLWHYRDVSFGLPLFAVTFDLHLDEQYVRGPEAAAAHDILIEVMEMEVIQLQYTLRLINARALFSPSSSGFQLHIDGISSALPDATKATLNFLKRFFARVMQKEEFSVQRVKLLQKAVDNRKSHLRTYAREAWGWIAFRGEVSDEEREAAFTAITFETFTKYFADCSKKMFAEVLISGNVSKEEAIDVFESSVSILNSRLTTDLRPAEFYLFKMDSPAVLLLPNPSPTSQTSSVAVHYYLGTEMEAKAFAKVLFMAVAEKFFTDLRIKQKAGYDVAANQISASGHQLFRFTIETTTSPAEESLQRILEFVKREAVNIEKMTQEQFKSYQAGARVNYVQPLTGIPAQHNYMYEQIFRHHDNSANKKEVLRKIDELTLEDFKTKFREAFLDQPKRFSLIFAGKKDLENTRKEVQKITQGNDKLFFTLKDYHATRDVYPDLFSLRKKLAA